VYGLGISRFIPRFTREREYFWETANPHRDFDKCAPAPRMTASIVASGSLAALKLLVGLLSGSLGLLTDAAHSMSAVTLRHIYSGEKNIYVASA
jgi:hypothetical protein